MAFNPILKRNLVTVPDFVPNPLKRPRILFITENYPKDVSISQNNTFLYRTINHPTANFSLYTNQLLINLSNCFRPPSQLTTEMALLNHFMNVSNYYVIDTYQYGAVWNNTTPLCGTVNEIIEDINFLNPEQIVLCYKRSNTVVYNNINAGINPGIKIIRPIDATGNIIDNVFVSPTGQWHKKFYQQIQLVIQNNILIP